MNRPFWSLRPSPQDICDSIAPLLSAYADGMASPAEARRIETHLPECENCRAALSWMQATRTVLAARPVAVPPPDLHSRIALAIAASSAPPVSLRPARVFTLRTAYAAAASVTVLGLALSYGLRHTPSEVAVTHPVRPSVVATVPPPAVKPQAVPKTSARPLVASNSAKTGTVKHTIIARKIAPSNIVPPEHTASNAVPMRLPAVPSIITKAPVHHVPMTQKIASADTTLIGKHSIEKHSPLPTAKTPAPKLPDTLTVAKIIKEPAKIPLVMPATRVTPDPVVQTASTRLASPSVSSDPLGSYKARLKENEVKIRSISFASVSVPVGRAAQEATSVAQTAGSSDRIPVFGSIYSPR